MKLNWVCFICYQNFSKITFINWNNFFFFFVADFGISSLTPTSTTAMVGTIPYMAPDVVLVGPDRPYDTKVDIWSVGVCILELLTGKAAWGRFRDDEIMDKLRRGEMPYGFQRLRKKADIGWEAVDFLEKCFIKTPENRWDAEKLLEVFRKSIKNIYIYIFIFFRFINI